MAPNQIKREVDEPVMVDLDEEETCGSSQSLKKKKKREKNENEMMDPLVRPNDRVVFRATTIFQEIFRKIFYLIF